MHEVAQLLMGGKDVAMINCVKEDDGPGHKAIKQVCECAVCCVCRMSCVLQVGDSEGMINCVNDRPGQGDQAGVAR